MLFVNFNTFNAFSMSEESKLRRNDFYNQRHQAQDLPKDDSVEDNIFELLRTNFDIGLVKKRLSKT